MVTNPFLGHFLPLVPLAQELQARGHEVVVASEPGFGATVTAYGLDHVPVGCDLTIDDVLASVPDIMSVPPEEQDTYARPRMFVALRAHNVLDELRDFVDRFAPELVLRESAEFASWALAERSSLPHISVTLGAGESALEWGRLADPWFAELGDRVGLEHLDATSLHRYGLVSFAPAGYHDWSGTPGARTFRPGVAWTAQQVERDEAWDFGDRPIVYATLGTEFFDAGVMRRVVGAVVAVGAAAVVTTGPSHDPGTIETGSATVVVRRWIDQDRLLPHVAVVISHGGAGTVSGALCHGVPLVVVPRGADQFAHARRVEELGVGIAVSPAALESQLDDVVASVLCDPRFADAARDIARETARLPGVDAAARVVERIGVEP